MPNDPPIPPETRRVILCRPSRSEFFLVSTTKGFSLPEVSIPGRQRISANLNAAIKSRWNVDVVSIGEVATAGRSEAAVSKYEIVEVLEADGLSLPGLVAKSHTELDNTSFLEPEDHSTLKTVTTNDGQLPLCGQAGPFGRFGWFTDLKSWVRQELERFDLHLTGRFEQFNAGASFSLIRFETNRDAVWFKAVGEPNLREFAITVELAAALPRYVPTLLAADQKWHAWLSVEAPGELLSERGCLKKWQAAATALAELQIASIPHATRILAAGACDMRIPALRAQSDRLFEILHRLMGQQTKTHPSPLTPDEVRSLHEELEEVLLQLEQLEIPDALGHLDLNPGNVVVSPTGCTFLDWAEAAVGPPFFTLQYLIEHLGGALPTESDMEPKMVAAYGERWESLVGKRRLKAAMPLVPAATVFAYTAMAIAGRDMNFIEQSNTASSLRSLGRRLHREIAALRKRSAAS
jgi:hypothetical protein